MSGVRAYAGPVEALTMEEAASRFVYAIQAEESRRVKFGIAGNVETRLGELQCGNPERLAIVAKKPGTLAHERRIHHLLADHRLQGEWFEWCSRTDAVVRAINGELHSAPIFEWPLLSGDALKHWRIQPFEHTLAWLEYFD